MSLMIRIAAAEPGLVGVDPDAGTSADRPVDRLHPLDVVGRVVGAGLEVERPEPRWCPTAASAAICSGVERAR